MPYAPPITLTPRLVSLCAEVSELVGSWRRGASVGLSPKLRRENRIKTIQASLAIENNSLSIDQVTAILEGKTVLGSPREIQEVRNAIECYDQFARWKPHSMVDFLSAHSLMMKALVDEAGAFRRGGVGIYRGTQLIHMAPPAERVPHLISDLFQWLETTDHHPLIASSILHYEIEFIHPFSDGNGRIGRLWQSLHLASWHPELAWLPVESLIHRHQAGYYQALGAADQAADAAPFVDFMLGILRDTLAKAPHTDQVTDQVNDQVKSLIQCLQRGGALTAAELMECLKLRHRPTFRLNYLNPAMASGLVEMTEPDSPRSPTQRYQLKNNG